jgi:hypothetical protein
MLETIAIGLLVNEITQLFRKSGNHFDKHKWISDFKKKHKIQNENYTPDFCYILAVFSLAGVAPENPVLKVLKEDDVIDVLLKYVRAGATVSDKDKKEIIETIEAAIEHRKQSNIPIYRIKDDEVYDVDDDVNLLIKYYYEIRKDGLKADTEYLRDELRDGFEGVEKSFDNISEQIKSRQTKPIDHSATKQWATTIKSDFRNLKEKIKAVCTTMPPEELILLSNAVTSSKYDQQEHNEREIAALKFQVFSICQSSLLDIVDSFEELEPTDIDYIIGLFTEETSKQLEECSKDFKYPFTNKVHIRRLILDLINECYLSFDRKGFNYA